MSPVRTAPGVTTRALTSAQAELAARGLVHELERLGAEAGAELRAPGVRLGRHLDDGVADGELRACGQVLDAEIEVDVELVARERPAVPASGDHRGCARVHQRQLRVRVRRAVRHRLAAAGEPRVPDEADLEIERALVEHLALVLGGSADDQLDRALGGW